MRRSKSIEPVNARSGEIPQKLRFKGAPGQARLREEGGIEAKRRKFAGNRRIP